MTPEMLQMYKTILGASATPVEMELMRTVIQHLSFCKATMVDNDALSPEDARAFEVFVNQTLHDKVRMSELADKIHALVLFYITVYQTYRWTYDLNVIRLFPLSYAQWFPQL